MRIVQVEDFFVPEAGYQVNVLSKYLAKMGHEVIIVTSELEKIPDYLASFFGRENIAERDKRYEDLYGVKIVRLPIFKYISGRSIYFNLISKIKQMKPDILYVHNCNCVAGMQVLLNLKKVRCPVISDCHMLEMASRNKFNKYFHWFFKRVFAPIIKKEKIQVIRPQDDNYVEAFLGIPLSQAPYISFGSDTILFHPDENVRKSFRKELGINEDSFVVVYAGKLDESKGGKLLAEAFKNKFNTTKDVVLLVVGDCVGDYGKEVEALFEESENKIIRIPTKKYSELPEYYQVADISVFPRQCSLSFFDVQACALPIVSEDNEVNVERNANNNGLCFKAGDVEDFREKILAFCNMSQEDFSVYKQNSLKLIQENYLYEDIAQEYMDIITKQYEDYKNK